MIVLGLTGGVDGSAQDASAVILRDGALVAAVAEERLCGEKFARGRMPVKAMAYVLAEAGLALDDVDVVAWGGGVALGERVEDSLRFTFGSCPKLLSYPRALCHAASSFHASGFSEAKVITYGLSDDGVATALWQGKGGQLAPLLQIAPPHSLGLYYALMTQYLGFEREADEYKVMGLAAYGKPTVDLSWLLDEVGGSYALDTTYTRFDPEQVRGREERLFSDALEAKIGFPPRRGGRIGVDHKALAASCQARLEEVVLALLKKHVPQGERLCIAGSVGLNCSLNGKLATSGHFGDIFVQPASGGDGLSLGAAYLAAQDSGDKPQAMPHAFWGPRYDADAVREALTLFQLPFAETSDPAKLAAELIAEGQIVGWFQGRSEFGPRALGARSILADPRRANMKDQINRKVKFRETFRPFAPSVLAEQASLYFADVRENPFMTMAVPVTEQGAETLPATTHVNRTARVQTVDAQRAPAYFELISAFHSMTGCGAVLNTSLNVMGQPLACAPSDAVRVFACLGVDVLIMENFVLRKSDMKK